MLSILGEKRLLQAVIALGCLVPLSAGFGGAVQGIRLLGINDALYDSGSHFRYLSGLLLGIGIGFAGTIPRIEQNGARFRLLTMIVMTGGFSRLLGFFPNSSSTQAFWLPLAMELGVTPLLCLWQLRISKRLISNA